MPEITPQQIRNFRLHSHQLDGGAAVLAAPSASSAAVSPSATASPSTAASLSHRILSAAGICGLQNSPPGAWETSLFSRVPDCTRKDLQRLLTEEKTLLQAWSFRGAPVIFPTEDAPLFLQALAAREGEEWLYTHGIALALDFLELSFDQLLDALIQVIPRLDTQTIVSKSALDQTLAEWMLPLLPPSRHARWNSPSMYGDPERQTVGGAVVSFLLRPCSLLGLVVFGKRQETLPTFTSFKRWTGHPFQPMDPDTAVRLLVKKYLHAYGPSSPEHFALWLGCTKQQARRMWNTLSHELTPVSVLGKKAFLLSEDLEALLNPAPISQPLRLLGPHDPYLDSRDRLILQPDAALHRQIWKTVSNPGAILMEGQVIGIWNCRKKPKGLEIQMKLFDPEFFSPDTETPVSVNQDIPPHALQSALSLQAEQYAAFRSERLLKLDFQSLGCI